MATLKIRPICKELQEVAKKEIHEEPNRIERDLAYIKEWLSKQPHLKTRTDDQFLVTFLRGTKFSLERTKEKLDMHYTLKTITPELYGNRNPFDPEIQRVLSLGLMFPLPVPTPGSPIYMFFRNEPIERFNINMAVVMKVSAMMQDIMLLENDNLAVSGTIMVQDMSGVSLGFIRLVPIMLIKKAMTCFQQAYPHRIRGSHMFNIGKFFDAMYAIFKPFLTEKLKKRMQVYNNVDELIKNVPKHILPQEYGGQAGTIDELAAVWKAKIESYKDWFADDEKYRTDESKRPGKPKTSESVFGVEGSFRQLSVD